MALRREEICRRKRAWKREGAVMIEAAKGEAFCLWSLVLPSIQRVHTMSTYNEKRPRYLCWLGLR